MERLAFVAFFGLGAMVCLAALLLMVWKQRRAGHASAHGPRGRSGPLPPHAVGSYLLVLIAIPVQAGIFLLLELAGTPREAGTPGGTALGEWASMTVLVAGLIYVWRRWERL